MHNGPKSNCFYRLNITVKKAILILHIARLSTASFGECAPELAGVIFQSATVPTKLATTVLYAGNGVVFGKLSCKLCKRPRIVFTNWTGTLVVLMAVLF